MKYNLTKMIYLASPYSPRNKKLSEGIKTFIRRRRYETITCIAAKLIDKWKYAFILPITMSHNTAKHMNNPACGEFKNWATCDFTYISHCDEVWVVTMNGWDTSKGVTEEIKFAKSLNIKVSYVCPFTLRITSNPYNIKELK